MGDVSDKRERYSALIEGLDTERTTEINSATYLLTELNGLPRFKDDYEYKVGRGVRSTSLLHNLPVLFDQVESSNFSERSEYEMGESLKEYDLQDIAVYHFSGQLEEEEKSLGLKKERDRLEEDSESIEDSLEELAEKFEG